MERNNSTGKKITVFLLSMALVLTTWVPFSFAAEEDPVTVDPQSIEEPQGESEPDEPEEPKEVSLVGTVKTYNYGGSPGTASSASGKSISIALRTGSMELVSGQGGSFSASLKANAIPEDGNISWSFAGDETCLPANGTISVESGEIIIRERPIPSSADYTFDETDRIKKGFLEGAGSYTINAAPGKKLASVLDGEARDSLRVNISSEGVMDDIYVYTGTDCSRVLSGERHKMDDGAPEVLSVTTSAANKDTYVKSHGIYSKTKAEILVNADIKENGGGLNRVYLISKKDGKKPRFEPTSMTRENGTYSVSIALPEEETLLDADTVYLIAEDVFGHKSKETLIAKSEDGSSVTLEAIAPSVTKKIEGELNANGWYKTLPVISVSASDLHSGLTSIKIKEGGKLLKSETFDESKVNEEKTLKATAEAGSSKDGSYEFTVEASDNSGNTSEETFTLRIDLDAPQLSASGVTDGEYYREEPSITIKEKEAYHEADGNKISVQVRRNGAETKAEDFEKVNEAEVDPAIFSEDGRYTVRITAEDAAGNKADPLEYSFVKDSTAPELSLVNTGKANENGWYNEEPEFTATSADGLSGLVMITIKQDGSAAAKKSLENSMTEESLSAKADVSEPSIDGSYTFTAEATDRAGNKAEKEITLKIDTVAPVLSAEGVASNEHYRSVPAIKINETERYYDAKGAFIRCQVKRNKNEEFYDVTLKQTKEGIIRSGVFNKDGVYDVTIMAMDAAGNAARNLHYRFVKDSKAPSVTLTGVTNGKYYNKKQAVTLTVIEKNYKTNKVNVSAVRKLGGRTYKIPFPWKNSGRKSVSTRSFAETGTYTVTASAKDKAGNASGAKSLTFTVDTVPPVIDITGVSEGGVYTYGQSVNPKVTVTDDYLESKSISYTKAGETVTAPSFEQLKENDGLWTLTATASDKAGNTTTKQVSFVVNRFGSHFEYNDAIRDLMGRAVQKVGNDLIITEKNVSKLTETDADIIRDGKATGASAKTSSSEGAAENVYRHTFAAEDFEDEGAYEINVVSKDEAGNEMESRQENGKIIFYVDRTEPSLSVSGIDPKGIKGESAELTVKVSDTLTGVEKIRATIDGKETALKEGADGTLSLTITEGMRQSVYITAKDKAGNEAVFSDTVSVSASPIRLWFDRMGKYVAGGAGALAVIGGGSLILAKRKRKDNEEASESSEE